MAETTAAEYPNVIERRMGERPPRVGISACLVGQEVRWDGGHKRDPFLTELLGRYVEWVPVCPEVEIGMGIPREPIRLEGDPAAPRLVGSRTRTDHTAAMRRLARARVATLTRQDLVAYVLKKDSPSCGMDRVRVHRPNGSVTRAGVGAFARELMKSMPLLPIEDEGRLRDVRLREHFVERLFAYARWRTFTGAQPTRGGLVAFHAAHKYQLMAHAPAAYRKLGTLVGSMKGNPLRGVIQQYGKGFMLALRTPATRGRNANVIDHLLGYVSDGLGRAERREMVQASADYRRGLVPLGVPLTLLEHHVGRADLPYLHGQTYLDPYPKELMLRHHV